MKSRHRRQPMSRRAVMEILGFGVAAVRARRGRWVSARRRFAHHGHRRLPRPLSRCEGASSSSRDPTARRSDVPPCWSASRTTAARVGWGESVPIPKWSDETLETVTTTIRHYLAPELIGRDPADIPGAHAVMNRSIAPAFSTGQPIAKAGIDIALHDLVARKRGVNVTALWNRTARTGADAELDAESENARRDRRPDRRRAARSAIGIST